MPGPADRRPALERTESRAPSIGAGADETVAPSETGKEPAAPSFAPPIEAGEVGTLGPYRIIKELGRGGMGAVYAALDTRLNRKLALKVMLPKYAADPAAKERFLREARAAAQISHDNVVTVYEADEKGGVPYIAMQFLQGYPLDEYLKKKGSPGLPQIVRIAREAAAGLAAAHKLGLVHRDVKPGNLWLEAPGGRVKVLDFGLAKPLGADIELTQSGAVVGTPAYMAPEQARGLKIDHRADLFSLGVMLYRLCAGRLPFEGPTAMAVLMALGTEEPRPVRDHNPNVPEALAALIHQLLSKNPNDRPQTAEDVVKRLRQSADQMARKPAAETALEPSLEQLFAAPPASVSVSVTAGADNPFADLAPIVAATRPAPPKPSAAGPAPTAAPAPAGRKPRVPRWGIAAGAAAFLPLLVAGIIIVIKNRDGTQTTLDVPNNAKITVGEKDGKTVVDVDLAGKGTAETDRRLAKWVVSHGGKVKINFKEDEIASTAALPNEPFVVTWADLSGTSATDSDLEKLNGCDELRSLGLNGTLITDDGLAQLKHLKNLHGLFLTVTPITDAGLANLKDCKTLTHLGLHGTQTTSAGLVHLRGLTDLVDIDLRGQKTDPKDLADFHAAAPGCTIHYDGGTIEPGTSPELERQAAEWQPLFNGKDLSGWKTHPDFPGDWRIENSVLVGSSAGHSFLFSERGDYADVHLRLEASVGAATSAGVMVRANTDPTKKPTAGGLHGYLAKINVDNGVDGRKTGSLYVMEASGFARGNTLGTSPVKSDEWFPMDVIVTGGHVVVKVNGQTTTDFQDDHPLPAGRLALQFYNGDKTVRFRKIELKELDRASTASDRTAAEWALLQGEWDVPAEESQGTPLNENQIRQMQKTLVFANDRMTLYRTMADGRRLKTEGTVRLDPSANPKTWDFTGADYFGVPTEFRGLYQLDGDTLRLVYNARKSAEGVPPRPSAFRTAPGTKTVITHAKRKPNPDRQAAK